MSRRDVVDVGVRPRVLGADEAGQLVAEMIGDEPADEVALSEGSRPVDHAGIDADDRRAVEHRFVRQAIRRHLRPLVVVRLDRRGVAARWQRDERRGIQDARNLKGAGGRQHVAQPPTLTSSKSARRRRQMLTSAAECETASQPAAARSSASRSRTSPSIGVPEGRCGRRCAAKMTSSCPRAASARTTARPRYPVPPVTRTFMQMPI
jgi:hypothetical protein